VSAGANVLDPAGPVAADTARLAWALFGGAALVLAAVMLLTVWALRGRLHDVSPRRLIIAGGLVLPTVVLLVLLVVTLRSLPAPAAADALTVAVSGRMWWWEVRYRDPADPAREIVLANELRIPVGREVHLRLTTRDVIHSFWVPPLAGKVDMVPGRVNPLVLRADRPGVFRGPCAEFCGAQHTRMTLTVVAQPAAEFEAWLANEAQPARAPTTAVQERGRRAFVERHCVACHTVRGVAEGAAGSAPDLTHVGARLALGAGTLAMRPGAMRDWIANLQQHKPGAQMPSFDQLDAATLDAIAAYLEHLH
jgi:cytochrome c oxidase subunit 2